MKHRPIRRRFLLWVAVGSAVAGTSIGAGAQTTTTRAELIVEADPECANEAAIVERVRARSRAITFGSGGGTSLRAAIAPDAGGKFSARLTLSARGRSSQRQLAASSCKEAIDAVALLIALALDPSAGGPSEDRGEAPAPARPVRAPSDPSAPDRKAPATSTSTVAPPEPEPATGEGGEPSTSPAPEPAPAAETAPPPPQFETTSEATNETEASGFSVTANLEGRGVFGPAPELLPGVGLHVLVSWERDSVWSPALGIAGAHSWVSGLQENGGRAAFQLQLARLDVCVVRFRLGPAAVRGCGSGAIGRLHASGSETYDPAEHTRLLAVLGGSVLLQIELGAHLGLHAVANAGAPLVRDSFAFRPRTFHQVEAVVVDLGLGAGVRFP